MVHSYKSNKVILARQMILISQENTLYRGVDINNLLSGEIGRNHLFGPWSFKACETCELIFYTRWIVSSSSLCSFINHVFLFWSCHFPFFSHMAKALPHQPLESSQYSVCGPLIFFHCELLLSDTLNPAEVRCAHYPSSLLKVTLFTSISLSWNTCKHRGYNDQSGS